MQQYYGTAKAAKILKVDRVTVQRWCHAGLLSGAFLISRSRRLGWQIPQTSVHALLEEVEREALQNNVPA